MVKSKIKDLVTEILAKYYNAEEERINLGRELESDAELEKMLLQIDVRKYKERINKLLKEN